MHTPLRCLRRWRGGMRINIYATAPHTVSRRRRTAAELRAEPDAHRRGAASASSKAAACEPERSRRIGRVTSHDFLRAAASHGEPQSQPTALVTVPSGIRDSSSKTAIRVRLAGGPGLETARRTRMAVLDGVTPWHIPTASSKTLGLRADSKTYCVSRQQ